ncbi:MAG: hypothetical protein ACI845_004231 [Gammaproteobacteria bacterium]|jgi:hypothetical protein
MTRVASIGSSLVQLQDQTSLASWVAFDKTAVLCLRAQRRRPSHPNGRRLAGGY